MSERQHTDAADEAVEIAEEAAATNPDPHTRRESMELGLMEEGRSEAGEDVSITEDVEPPPDR